MLTARIRNLFINSFLMWVLLLIQGRYWYSWKIYFCGLTTNEIYNSSLYN